MTKDSHTTSPHQRGFTLVEIMVTLAVLAIVAALASPAIMQMAPNMRLRTAANELHANLMRAKSRAVKDNRNIGFSVTTVNCALPGAFTPGGNGGAYRIFIDDGAGNPLLARNNTYDAGEEILVDFDDGDAPDVIENLPESVALCAPTIPPAIAPLAATGFTTSGLLQNAVSGSVALKISTDAGEPYYQITLSPAGSVSMVKLP